MCRIYDKCEFKPDYSDDEIDFALKNVAIYHYVCFSKPWCHYDDTMPFRSWWQVALQTPFFADEFAKILQEVRLPTKNIASSPKIITSKTLKRFLKIAAKILPSSKARKQCRRLLSEW